jgi:hypothetical protein
MDRAIEAVVQGALEVALKSLQEVPASHNVMVTSLSVSAIKHLHPWWPYTPRSTALRGCNAVLMHVITVYAVSHNSCGGFQVTWVLATH